MRIKHVIFFLAGATLGCGGGPPPAPPPLDAQLDLYTNSANLEFQNDNLPSAATDFAKALDRARIIDDPASVAEAAYNLAICRAALGDYPSALSLLEEAKRDSMRIKSPTTNLILAEARVDLLMKNPAQASALAAQVLNDKSSNPTEEQNLQAHLVLGSAHVALNDTTAANADLSAASSIAKSDEQPGVADLAGELHLRAKNYPAAAADFDHEADLNRRNQQYREMIRALAKAGRAFASASQLQPASDRLYRAARAAVSRNDPDANNLVQEASTDAQKAGDAQLIKLVAALVPAPTSAPTTAP